MSAMLWHQAKAGHLLEDASTGIVTAAYMLLPTNHEMYSAEVWLAVCMCGCGQVNPVNVRQALQEGGKLQQLGDQPDGSKLVLGVARVPAE